MYKSTENTLSHTIVLYIYNWNKQVHTITSINHTLHEVHIDSPDIKKH